jgi:medium-chain acyl-[acyl-carrier-protein] hydrolase
MIRTSASPADRWLPTVRPWSRAGLRLFCLPYAGGGASVYREWAGALGDSVEVCPVQLPGREARFGEPAFTRIGPLVEALADALGPHLDRPFALFGHSLGALVAFELARRLRRSGRPGPSHLFVSGCRAPQVRRAERLVHTLPDAAFRQELRRLGGTPAELLANDELMDLVLPTLRADFALCETYEYADGFPLPCPVTALGGRDDGAIGRDDLEAWRVHTTARFAAHVLPGDHFFVRSARARVLAEIRRALGAGGGTADGLAGLPADSLFAAAAAEALS